MGDHHVRLARPDDVPLLPGIGHAADRRFLDSPYPWIADLPPDDVVPFEAAQDRWCLWVATDAADRPVGFLCLIELMPGTLHVTHLAVDPAHGRRGLGGLTIEAMARFHAPRGCRRLTLTTFDDVPWNAPYYARLGFNLVPSDDTSPELERRRREEAGEVLPLARRVVMVREIRGGDPA